MASLLGVMPNFFKEFVDGCFRKKGIKIRFRFYKKRKDWVRKREGERTEKTKQEEKI